MFERLFTMISPDLFDGRIIGEEHRKKSPVIFHGYQDKYYPEGIPPEVLDGMKALIGREFERFKTLKKSGMQRSPEVERILNSAINHAMCFDEVKNRFADSDHKVNLITARDSQTGDFVGFSGSVISRNAERTKDLVYVGVESNQQRMGIGSRLVTILRRTLLEQGETYYLTNVNKSSFAIIRELGVPFDIVQDDDSLSSLPVRIHLIRDNILEQYGLLNLDPSIPVSGPYSFTRTKAYSST